MQYIQVTFIFKEIEEFQKDLFIDEMASIGFNTFEETEGGFAAFIEKGDFKADEFAQLALGYESTFQFNYTISEIAGQNWNQEWEKNFEPLVINDLCYVRATFHAHRPEFPYEIIIDPKMAFGTGHHQTTKLMIQYIISEELDGKSVLDMGCGTGILAILSSKKGARDIVAIDYDEVCFHSTVENITLNSTYNIQAFHGGKESIPDQPFDIILANINRNILLDQLPSYAKVLKPGGHLFLSGFYEDPDLSMIKKAADDLGISFVGHLQELDWVAARFRKEPLDSE